jgi:hypothetical protein
MEDDENNSRYLAVAKIERVNKREKSKKFKTVNRKPIIKDEHSCFGYFKKDDKNCHICEARWDCDDQ